ALQLAAFSGHGKLGVLLLEHGADPNYTGTGYSPLHAAVLREDIELVRALLARGAAVNERLRRGTPQPTRAPGMSALRGDWIGATRLWIAGGLGNAELVRLLLAEGANPHLMPNDGTTLLMAAAQTVSATTTAEGLRTYRIPEQQSIEV